MTSRITISLSPDGMLEIYLNPEGRDLLVRELQKLSAQNDHVNLDAEDVDPEVPLRTIAYRGGDRIIDCGKILFRPDEWDAEYFAHVLAGPTNDGM